MMRNVFRSLCLVVGLFAVSVPAQAADYWHPYAGAGVGSILIDAGLGGKTALGGYGMVGNDFNENVGVEVRFGGSGKTGSTVTVPQGQVCGYNQFEQLVCTTVATPTPANVSV
ncbi:MAG TPA: outer membrane beta-barrel protein, partial [Mariprofundaceae bacterium]|nr:outer membrane beta-barrel protein [Mariprofundaceae bacterium]